MDGTGSNSLVPPSIFNDAARGYHSHFNKYYLHRDNKLPRKDYYAHLLKFEAIGLGIDHTLLRKKKATKSVAASFEVDVPFCHRKFIRKGNKNHPYFTNSSRPVVLVVGGGVAGLRASSKLVLAGCNVVMIEAKSRIGGRVFGQFGIDHGSMFLGPNDPQRNPAIQLAMEYVGGSAIHHHRLQKLRRIYDRDGKRFQVKNGWPDQMKKTNQYVKHKVRKIERKLRKEKESLYRLFYKDTSLEEKLQKYINYITRNMSASVRNDVTYELWKKYLLPYGSQSDLSFRSVMNNDERNVQLSNPDFIHSYTTHYLGTSVIVHYLYEHLSRSKNFKLLKRHELVDFGRCKKASRYGLFKGWKVRRDRKGYPILHAKFCHANVHNLSSKKKIKIAYDTMLVTLPSSVMKANLKQFLSPKTSFHHHYDERYQHLKNIKMANICKVIIYLKHKVPSNYTFVSDTTKFNEQLIVFKETRRQDVGSMYISDHLCKQFSNMTKPKLSKYIKKRLKISTWKVRRIQIVDWSKDSYIRGVYPYFSVNARLHDARLAAKPLQNRIFFAGDWVSHQHYGTLVGSMWSAEEAAFIIAGHPNNAKLYKRSFEFGGHTSSEKVYGTQKTMLWFFPGSDTRDMKGRLKGSNKNATHNIMLKAGHLGISDDRFPITEFNKRIYGFLPILNKIHTSKTPSLFRTLFQNRVLGQFGNDIVSFRDAAYSEEGFVICNVWLNLIRKYVCKTKDCGAKLAEELYIRSSENRGMHTGFNDTYYAFPWQTFSKWPKADWNRNTFNCITFPQKKLGLNFSGFAKLAKRRQQFRSLKPNDIVKLATSGSATDFALLLADFTGAACDCWRHGRRKPCSQCPVSQQHYCRNEPQAPYMKKSRRR